MAYQAHPDVKKVEDALTDTLAELHGKPRLKVGRLALDPMNRRVKVVELDSEWARVQYLANYSGREATTAKYPRSCVTPLAE